MYEYVGKMAGDVIAGLPPEKKLRIGTYDGFGFLFVGKRKDFSAGDIENLIADIRMKSINLTMKHTSYLSTPRRKADALRKVNETCRAWLESPPIVKREVVEAYEGAAEPDALILIVKGDENGKQYNPPMPSINEIEVNDEGAQRLFNAIYREPAVELRRAVKKERTTKKRLRALQSEREAIEAMMEEMPGLERSEQELRENTDLIEAIGRHQKAVEKSIMTIPYMDAEGNEAVIREARITVGRKKKK